MDILGSLTISKTISKTVCIKDANGMKGTTICKGCKRYETRDLISPKSFSLHSSCSCKLHKTRFYCANSDEITESVGQFSLHKRLVLSVAFLRFTLCVFCVKVHFSNK